MKTLASLGACMVLLTACSSLLGSDNNGQPTNADDAQNYLSNKTNLYTYEDGSTEIEYTAADGKAYYWVVENQAMVVGDWRVADTFEGGYEICFRYPTGSIEYYDDAGAVNYGYWDCSPGNDVLGDGFERAEGNPLGLKEGAVPFVIPFGTPYTMETAAQELGVDPSGIKYLPVAEVN